MTIEVIEERERQPGLNLISEEPEESESVFVFYSVREKIGRNCFFHGKFLEGFVELYSHFHLEFQFRDFLFVLLELFEVRSESSLGESHGKSFQVCFFFKRFFTCLVDYFFYLRIVTQFHSVLEVLENKQLGEYRFIGI